MRPIVQIRGLQYFYSDGTEALKGIDLDINAGESVALLGANGSGKTTLLLHLNGLLQGTGEVTVCGMPVEPKHFREIRRRVGLVFQDADEQLFMPTVLEDVAYGPLNLGCRGEEAVERARAALAAVGLEALGERAPYHLSAGEKRRVAIAGVLAMHPDVLVLDEPTTSLDPPSQRELVRLLRRLPQTKIITTHDIAFARAISNRALFFKEGLIVGRGSVDEVVTAFDWDLELNGE